MNNTKLDDQVRLLAAIAYGEASTLDDENEVLGIAFAVTNRARAWSNKTVEELLAADPNYTYAAKDPNQRFRKLAAASEAEIVKDHGMKHAVESAKKALANEGNDPSNGAYWWDGPDLKEMRTDRKGEFVNQRIIWGFVYGNPLHNIYGMNERKKTIIKYWQVRDKKTGKIENSTERGRFDAGYISTAAHGKTIFWRYTPDFVKSMGAKEYK